MVRLQARVRIILFSKAPLPVLVPYPPSQWASGSFIGDGTPEAWNWLLTLGYVKFWEEYLSIHFHCPYTFMAWYSFKLKRSYIITYSLMAVTWNLIMIIIIIINNGKRTVYKETWWVCAQLHFTVCELIRIKSDNVHWVSACTKKSRNKS